MFISAIKNLLTFFFALFILSACQADFFNKPKEVENKNSNSVLKVINSPQPGQVAIIESNIVVNQPLNNAVISSPLKITGRVNSAKGVVFFKLKDFFGNEIAKGSAMSTSIGSGFNQYEGILEYKTPIGENGSLDVYIESSNENDFNNFITLPVIFSNFDNLFADVYFSNKKINPNLPDCSVVHPIRRKLEPKSGGLPLLAMAELLKGLSNEEIDQGFITSIPEKDVKVQKLEVKDGIAYIDFNEALQKDVAGSCKVIAIRSQIIQTLKSLPNIKEVVISIDGQTKDILQP